MVSHSRYVIFQMAELGVPRLALLTHFPLRDKLTVVAPLGRAGYFDKARFSFRCRSFRRAVSLKPNRVIGNAVLLWFSGFVMSIHFLHWSPSGVPGIGEKSASIPFIPRAFTKRIDSSSCWVSVCGWPKIWYAVMFCGSAPADFRWFTAAASSSEKTFEPVWFCHCAEALSKPK